MRVLVFGVDGLTFRVLKPLMARGSVPHFQRIYEGGTHALLRSLMPPLAAPAWKTLITGLPLAAHGVFDAPEYAADATGWRDAAARAGGSAIWNLLSAWGKRVVVANVPQTYPPEPVSGLMLCGAPAPPLYAGVAYPPDFKDELLQAVPRYQIGPASRGPRTWLTDPLEEILRLLEARLDLLRLILPRSWDLCCVVLREIDLLQHLYWDRLSSPDARILRCYRLLDEALGLALAALQPGDLFMIVSPYGFQSVRRTFYLREYLLQRGLLAPTGRLSSLTRGGSGAVSSCRRRLIAPLDRRLRRATLLAPLPPSATASAAPLRILPSSGELSGYAGLALAETFSEEAIESLIIDLQALTDPETAYPAVDEIYREEAFGSGPYAPPGRYLLLQSHDGVALSTRKRSRQLWAQGDPCSGMHHPDGLLCLYGAGVGRAVLKPVCIYDIAPTVLRALGVPIPPTLSGTPLLRELVPLESLSQM